MDFRLSEEEAGLQEAARRFARTHVEPVAARMEREDHFPRELFRRMGADGFLGITVPVERGGLGLSYLAQALILVEIARVSPALALSVGAHSNLCVDNLSRNGSDDQRARYLPDLVSGEHVGALALTEPGAGSDAVGLRTTAVRRGSHFVLNGSKQFITNGPVADSLIVYAKTAPDRGSRGISAFIVSRTAPGFSVSRSLDKMGMRGSPAGELAFHDVEVPADQLLGTENQGVEIMMAGLNVERAVLSAIPVGIITECLELSVRYAKEREQFGQKIGRFQLIQAKLANMYFEQEASRLLLYEALASVQTD
ncbi:MAG: acyl-CoA dehydrogenase family protein, partial [Thermoplasmata archaeon]